ncbi:hypothetical protein [Bizionia arctica]|uniref:Uncharacterized protein n=1 Tax=Bizionia arctica TaxID=1495645 RepID=A0A917GR42_9FLAO|nr:hypothetical protein [Bizionia arctica]GGG54006.1 hypothetical protein GCM10010976_26210 [Bizionia arctica]
MKFPFKSIAFITFSVLAIFLISCKSDDDSIVDECEEAVCPHVVITIDVYIIDENQDPVALDSYEVIDIENGEVLTTPMSPANFEYYQQLGEYPLITGPMVNGQEKDLLFKGFINDIEVISSSYKVGRDCCFVNLISGDTNLVLQ